MFAMKTQRGKPPTRGAYQIIMSNNEIKGLYHYIAFRLTIVRLSISALFTVGGIKPNLVTQSATNIIVCHFSIPAVLLLISFIISRISQPIYSNTPERRLISPGYDMVTGGWGDYFQEIAGITVLTHLLTVVSNIFWFLLLLLPLRWLYLFWIYFLRPILIIIFTTDNESDDSERKKAKKKKRVRYLRTIRHWHHFR